MMRLGFVTFLLLITLLSDRAWAIPSPDIVINIFASLAQVLGLLSLTVGGLFHSLGRRKKPVASGGSP